MPPAETHQGAAAPAGHLRGLVVGMAVAGVATVVLAAIQAWATPADAWILALSTTGIAMATALPLLVQRDAADEGTQGHLAVLVPVLYLLAWHQVAEEETLVQRIADGLAGLEANDGRSVDASFGVALAPRDGRSARELYDVADQRMYAVKHGEAA